ncbi:hypothetical protein SCHPADRAFT_1000342 [Schizopora paradoxa]|uniref:F-box domain-containing protein n=1 Tax=Schizopora paradoxa TaxID=27342 RepID=A0A0H2RBU8_9AGAM|nr:hypothetical protein SCHPADRAFT_1000342 [Schizopora paradoxa]
MEGVSAGNPTSGSLGFSPGFGNTLANMLTNVAKYIAVLPSITEHLTPDHQKISNLKIHLKDVRDVKQALDTLSNALGSCIPSLEKQFSDAYIREHYPQFPDEILAIIFEFAGLDDFGTAISISHVCRRFRTIALSISRLWISIRPIGYNRGFGVTVEDASEVARRSQPSGIGLEIQVEMYDHYKEEQPKYYGEYLQSMTGFLHMHSSRIRVLALDIGVTYFIRDDDKSAFENLSFPLLDSMKIFSPPGTTLQHIYKNWNLPSLRLLVGQNCLPELSKDILSKINSFTFEVEEYNHPDDNEVLWLLEELADYLVTLSSLKELKMDIDCDHAHYTLPDFDESHVKVELQELRHLTLKIQHTNYHYDTIMCVFMMFDYERLTSLSLELPISVLPDFSPLFDCIRCTSGSLKQLDVRIHPKVNYYNNYRDLRKYARERILEQFLGVSSTLETIYLECAGDDRKDIGFENRIAALQLKNCQLLAWTRGNGQKPDIAYDLEEAFKPEAGPIDECLVLDGAETSPLEKAKIIRVPLSGKK